MPQRVHADWPTDPSINLPIAVIPYQNELPAIAHDGFGGFVVVWEGWRDLATVDNIYAQRITASGHPQWPLNGIQVTSLPGIEVHAQVVPTTNGVIVVWADDQLETGYDIYAQHVDLFGNLTWDARGVPLCTAAGSQDSLVAISDGQGGAIVAWRDHRSYATTKSDIYAQRIDAAGVVVWPTDGVAVCTATGEQMHLRCDADGHGGIVTVWEDWRNMGSTGRDIYAQRLGPDGGLRWTSDGVPACVRTAQQTVPELTGMDGGAVFAWKDDRSPGYGAYAQRLSGAGDRLWADGGVSVRMGAVSAPTVAAASSGMTCFAWTLSGNIFAQKLDSLGTHQWAAAGIPVCAATNSQDFPEIIRDECDGVIISWMDFRNASSEADVYAQKVLSNGTFVWAADGVPVSTAPKWQADKRMLPDGRSGAFFAWQDARAGLFGPYYIYAQRIDSTGALTTPTAVRDQAPGMGAVRLGAPLPNPASGVTRVSMALDVAGTMELRVYDVRGREVWSRVDTLPAGESFVLIPGTDRSGRPLPQGIYFLSAKSGGATATRKFTLVR